MAGFLLLKWQRRYHWVESAANVRNIAQKWLYLWQIVSLVVAENFVQNRYTYTVLNVAECIKVFVESLFIATHFTYLIFCMLVSIYSASYPQGDGKRVVVYRLRGEGLVWLTGAVVCLLDASVGPAVRWHGPWMTR